MVFTTRRTRVEVRAPRRVRRTAPRPPRRHRGGRTPTGPRRCAARSPGTAAGDPGARRATRARGTGFVQVLRAAAPAQVGGRAHRRGGIGQPLPPALARGQVAAAHHRGRASRASPAPTPRPPPGAVRSARARPAPPRPPRRSRPGADSGRSTEPGVVLVIAGVELDVVEHPPHMSARNSVASVDSRGKRVGGWMAPEASRTRPPATWKSPTIMSIRSMPCRVRSAYSLSDTGAEEHTASTSGHRAGERDVLPGVARRGLDQDRPVRHRRVPARVPGRGRGKVRAVSRLGAPLNTTIGKQPW